MFQNHVLHTNIAIFILLEMCVAFRLYPSRKAGLTGLGLFMSAYLVWIHVIHHVSGVWVYPILEVGNFKSFQSVVLLYPSATSDVPASKWFLYLYTFFPSKASTLHLPKILIWIIF